MTSLPLPEPSLVHLGYIKTATTLLQRAVFDRAEAGLGLAGGTESRAHLAREFVLADDYVFDATATGDRLRALEAPLRAAGRLPVWSEEVLLGDPLVRRYDGPANLRRIAAALPGSRILITIREQRAIALSMFREYAKQGGTLPLRDFIGTGHERVGFTPILRPDFLLFDRAVAAAQAAFGANRVLVLPQEMLVGDPAGYFRRLGVFLDRDIPLPPPDRRDNRGRRMPALRLGLVLNHFAPKSPLNQDFTTAQRVRNRLVSLAERLTPPGLARRMEKEARAQIAARYDGMFTQSNRHLTALTGLPLGEYGYM